MLRGYAESRAPTSRSGRSRRKEELPASLGAAPLKKGVPVVVFPQWWLEGCFYLDDVAGEEVDLFFAVTTVKRDARGNLSNGESARRVSPSAIGNITRQLSCRSGESISSLPLADQKLEISGIHGLVPVDRFGEIDLMRCVVFPLAR